MKMMKRNFPLNRIRLEKILAAQRETRARPHKNKAESSPRVNSLTAALFLCASLLSFLIVVQVSQANGRVMGRAGFPGEILEAVPQAAADRFSHRICTGIPEGRLNVRLTAGTHGRVIGHLMEGQSVLSSGRFLKVQEQSWLEITWPVTGWVNSRYACDQKQLEK